MDMAIPIPVIGEMFTSRDDWIEDRLLVTKIYPSEYTSTMEDFEIQYTVLTPLPFTRERLTFSKPLSLFHMEFVTLILDEV